MSVENFVAMSDIERIGKALVADARRCGDEHGADAIELFVDEIRTAVTHTIYALSEDDILTTLNGGQG